MNQLELHPLCAMFPRICGAEMDDLRDDIKRRGLDQPIVLFDGQILDGRHRYEVCLDIGVAPMFTEYQGDDPLGYVIAANVRRRHMTAGQQSALVGMATLKNVNRDKHLPSHDEGASLHPPPVTVAKAAKAAGVSKRSVQMARKVGQSDPEALQEVINGTVTLPEAVEKVTGKRPGKHKPLDAAELARELDEVREQRDQLAEDNRQLLAENESMSKIIDADGDLSAAHKIIKSLEDQVKKLSARIAGLQREKNAAISAAKSAQRKVSKK